MPAFERELSDAVRNAYRAFPALSGIGPRLRVCPCCIDDAAVDELVRTPREFLTGEALGAWLGSAHDCDGAAMREFRHFLPRLLELIAEGEEIGLVSVECALRRLGPGPSDWPQANYRASWDREEIAALDQFFRAYWLKILHDPPRVFRRPGTGEALFEGNSAEQALCMIAHAGGDLSEMLRLCEACDAPAADCHLAALVSSATVRPWTAFPRSIADGALGDAHWESAPEGEREIVRWLLRAATCGRLAAACIEAPQGAPQVEILALARHEVERAIMLRAARGRKL